MIGKVYHIFRVVQVFFYTLQGTSLYMKSLTQFGKMLANHVAKRMGNGKAIKPTFFCMRLAINFAAGSASIKNGMGQVFLSVILERTNPGQTVFT